MLSNNIKVSVFFFTKAITTKFYVIWRDW